MVALYLHWPFCQSKCPYCDFNSHVRNSIDEKQWAQAYANELYRLRQRTGPSPLTSLFFGGGTPSLMSPSLVAFLIEECKALWPTDPSLEITLEANPTSVEQEKLKDLAHSGIQRLSLGVQSFDEQALKFLGRQHSSAQASRALELAYSLFPRVSFDLIYGRPHQTLKDWALELTQALTFPVSHLSLYQLTIEQGTAFFHRHARGEILLPEEELAADLYQLTLDLLAEKGIVPYEISNFSLPGERSRHNLSYWRYEDYGGVGPGAHGRLTARDLSGKGRIKYATHQWKAPETWLAHAMGSPHEEDPQGNGAQEHNTPLSPLEQAKEQLMMGLRLFDPFDLQTLAVPWPELIDTQRLEILHTRGLIERDQEKILLSLPARLCLNEVLRFLWKDLP